MKHFTIIAFLPCGTSPPSVATSSNLHASLKLMGNKENGYTRNTYGFKIVMKYYMFFTVLLTISSCNYKKKKMTLISNRHNTTIIYDIDNLSSEGAEARVLYRDGKIKESTIFIYGAGGKTEIEYLFTSNFIRVREQTYLYQDTTLNTIDTLRVLRYKIDYSGKTVEKSFSQYTDIFEEFKKAVPFILK